MNTSNHIALGLIETVLSDWRAGDIDELGAIVRIRRALVEPIDDPGLTKIAITIQDGGPVVSEHVAWVQITPGARSVQTILGRGYSDLISTLKAVLDARLR